MTEMDEPAAYRRCILTFFDVLGFRQMVTTLKPNEVEAKVRALQAFSKIHDETAAQFEAKSFQFSDSIVRIMPVDSKANLSAPGGILFHEILAIFHAQLEMANLGVFLRGGLTIGDAYYSESVLFGPAMVDAYELESKLAIYPRVVVDPNALVEFKKDPLLKKDTHSVAQEADYLKKMLRRDTDGLWFIDYLFAASTECDEPELYMELLRNHKKAIEESLSKAKRIDGVVQKLNWLLRYHNSVIRRLENKVDAGRLSIEESTAMSPSLP